MYTRSSSYEEIEAGGMREFESKSLRRKRGKREIAIGLREWIDNHPDFDRIPSEMRIARQYEVSRMTARDAVKILKDEGLVYSKNQKTFIMDGFEDNWFAFGSGEPCPKCSERNRVHMLGGEEVIFCYSCGKRLAHKCESCDREFIVGNNDRVLFCPSCGNVLPSTDSAPNEDLVKEPA